MNDKIFTYWEGEPSDLYRICLETLERWNPGRVVILSPDDLPQKVLDATEGLPICFRSDLARVWALLDQGGVWVDADTIAVRPLSLLDEVPGLDLFGTHNKHQKKGWGATGISATPFGGRAGNPILLELFNTVLDLCLAMKTEGVKSIPYGMSSVGALSHVWKHHQEKDTVRRFPHWRWNPVPWYRAQEVYKAMGKPWTHEMSWWNPNAELYHLTNPITDHWKNAPRDQLLKGSTFLAFLVQKALSQRTAIFGRTSEIVRRLPLDRPIRGAEVGVFKAVNARHLLQQRPNLTLLLVDAWKDQGPGSYRASGDYQARYTQAHWDRIFHQVVPGHLKPFPAERYTLDRRLSHEAAQDVPDHSLDFVFIDGDHSYQGVKKDLEAWISKVKPGGFLSGHDYGSPREGPRYGVRKAVDELAASLGVQVERGLDMFWGIGR